MLAAAAVLALAVPAGAADENVGDFATDKDAWRVDGSNRYMTSLNAARKFYVVADEKDLPTNTVVLASGRKWPDSLSAAALAGAFKAPVLLMNDDKDSPIRNIVADLAANNVTEIYVMGGTAAVSQKAVDNLRKKLKAATGNEISVERVAGKERYATAVEAAKKTQSKIGAKPESLFVMSGADYKGALAAGPASWNRSWPVILVPPQGPLPESVRQYLLSVKGSVKAIYTVTGVPVDKAANLLELQATSIAGSWGQISAKFAEEAGTEAQTVAVVSDRSPWDALSAAALIGVRGGTVLPVGDGTKLSGGDVKRLKKACRTYVFGGEAAVSKASFEAVEKVAGTESGYRCLR